jgi:hypothetical protein
MRSRSILAVVLGAACALPGCASSAPDVLGRQVRLVPREPRAGKPDGELLAVQDGRVWLRTKQGVRDFPAADYRGVQVERHDFGRFTRRFALIGGAVSFAALTASCSSVEGNGVGGCAAAGALVGGILALTGYVSSMSLDASSRVQVSPSDGALLRPYARFPAGMPRDVPPEWLARPPEKKNERLE